MREAENEVLREIFVLPVEDVVLQNMASFHPVSVYTESNRLDLAYKRGEDAHQKLTL